MFLLKQTVKQMKTSFTYLFFIIPLIWKLIFTFTHVKTNLYLKGDSFANLKLLLTHFSSWHIMSKCHVPEGGLPRANIFNKIICVIPSSISHILATFYSTEPYTSLEYTNFEKKILPFSFQQFWRVENVETKDYLFIWC